MGLNESHPLVKDMAEKSELFVKSCLLEDRSNGTWLLVSGQTGSGKTHVARRVMTYYDHHRIEAWSRGHIRRNHIPCAVWIHWPTACDMSSAGFREFVQDEVAGGHLIIIDDFGAESDRLAKGECQSRLLRLLESAERKWLFATTNIDPSRWEEAYDQRISDRLLSSNFVTLFDVPSYRSTRNA